MISRQTAASQTEANRFVQNESKVIQKAYVEQRAKDAALILQQRNDPRYSIRQKMMDARKAKDKKIAATRKILFPSIFNRRTNEVTGRGLVQTPKVIRTALAGSTSRIKSSQRIRERKLSAEKDLAFEKRLKKQMAIEKKLGNTVEDIFLRLNLNRDDKRLDKALSSFKTAWKSKNIKTILKKAYAIKYQLGIDMGRVLARKTLDIPTGAYIIGGRVALAADALKRGKDNEVFKAAIGDAWTAIKKGFDPRRPEGIVNLVLVGSGIYLKGSSLAAKRQWKIDLKNGKVLKSKGTTIRLKNGKYLTKTKGTMKVGKKTFKFKASEITDKGINTGKFSSKTKASFEIKPGQWKSIKLSAKGIKKTSFKHLKMGKKFKRTQVSTSKGKVTGKGVKTKFKTTTIGKKSITVLESNKAIKTIKSIVSKLKVGKSKTTFNLKQFQKLQTVKGLRFYLKKTITKLKTELRAGSVSRKYSKTQIKNIKSGISEAQKLYSSLAKSNKKALGQMFKSKKASESLTRGRGERQIFTGRDTKAADNIMKNLEKKLSRLNAAKKNIRGSAKARATIKNLAKPSRVSLETLLPGAGVILKPIVYSIVPFLPNLSYAYIQGQSSPKTISNALALDSVLADSASQSIADTGSVPSVTPGTVPGVDPGVVPKTLPTPSIPAATRFINNIFVGVPDVFIPGGIIPFIPIPPIIGGGTPGAKGTQRGFRFPQGLLADKFFYSSDLYSRLFGGSVSLAEGKKLLTPGKIFTGLERRKVIRRK